MRRSGVGASEAPAIVERQIPNVVGLDEAGAPIISGVRIVPVSPYEDAAEVYWRKVPPYIETKEFTNAMMTGIFFESGVVDWYCHDQNVRTHRSRTRRHPKHGWMLATPDRMVIEGGAPVRLLEAKVAMDYRPRKAAPPGLEKEYDEWYSWGDDGDAVPQHYRLQVEQQMEVCEVEEADLAVFFCLRRELKIYRLRKNKSLAERIIDAGENFWHHHVGPRVEPEKRWIEGDSAMDWLQMRYAEYDGDVLGMAPEEAEDWARRYVSARSAESSAKARKEEAKARLCLMIADQIGIRGGWGDATWPLEGRGINYKGLAESLMAGMAPDERAQKLELFTNPKGRTFRCKVKPQPDSPVS